MNLKCLLLTIKAEFIFEKFYMSSGKNEIDISRDLCDIYEKRAIFEK
jgi:hypothetical protein